MNQSGNWSERQRVQSKTEQISLSAYVKSGLSPIQGCALLKLKEAQCSEPVKSRVPSILGYILLRYVLEVSFNFPLTFLQVNVIKMFVRQQCFLLTSGCFLWAPDNSNFFRFPFKVRVIVSCRESTGMQSRQFSKKILRTFFFNLQKLSGATLGQQLLKNLYNFFQCKY